MLVIIFVFVITDNDCEHQSVVSVQKTQSMKFRQSDIDSSVVVVPQINCQATLTIIEQRYIIDVIVTRNKTFTLTSIFVNELNNIIGPLITW